MSSARFHQEPVVKTLEDLRLSDTPAYMNDAWIGCLQLAIEQPEIIAWFREETGNRWSPGGTVIERMVDDATGAPHQFIVQFVKWPTSIFGGQWTWHS